MTRRWPVILDNLGHIKMSRRLLRLSRRFHIPDSYQAIHDLVVRYRVLVPCIGYPLHREEGFNPFFIVGSGRSGNTLLRRILCAHPAIHIPPETYRLGPAIKLFRQNRGQDWKHLVHLVLSEFEYHHHFDAFQISLRPLALRLLESPPAARSLALILNSFYRYHSEAIGKPSIVRWGDKTPINIFWLETIEAVFPRANFIHIIRDGCDVVSSYLKSGLILDLDAAAQRWMSAVQAGERFTSRHREISLVIRYEDLVTEPEKVTKQVCHFLQIEYHPAMIESEHVAHVMGDVPVQDHHSYVKEAISPASIGKGRRELGLADRQRLQNQIGHYLKRMGYMPCT